MSKLIINNKFDGDIPYNEYYIEGVTYKGLVFVQHGFESNKSRGSDYLSINLARQKFYVVAIDAYKHGERIEEPFISGPEFSRYAEAFIIVEHTSNDIISLFERRYKDNFESFDMIGISMGGFIAYTVSLKCSYVNRLIPVITTPDFVKLASTRTNVPGIDEYRNEVQKNMKLIEEINPISRVEDLQYNSMFLMNCSKDPVLDYRPTLEFYNKYKSEKIAFKLYEDVHTVNREMQVDILEYISNKKVVL